MGCVSSNLLNHDDDFTQIGGTATGLGHHIVSLTSTTYGFLTTLDSPTTPPSPPPPLSASLSSLDHRPLTTLLPSQPEVINSWELMAGLDNDSFRFPFTPVSASSKPSTPKIFSPRITRFPRDKENSNPNPSAPASPNSIPLNPFSLDGFEKKCPPGGQDKLILYTTTLRGVRKTFDDCNAVRSALQSLGLLICERDISMDCGFKLELKQLFKDKDSCELIPPRVFVKGRYLGGAEQVLRIHEEGSLAQLLQGLPKAKTGEVCDGCGGARFLPCFQCNGSCKLVTVAKNEIGWRRRRIVAVKCSDCNENGLVLCPICS